jgi:hypothetical protein
MLRMGVSPGVEMEQHGGAVLSGILKATRIPIRYSGKKRWHSWINRTFPKHVGAKG